MCFSTLGAGKRHQGAQTNFTFRSKEGTTEHLPTHSPEGRQGMSVARPANLVLSFACCGTCVVRRLSNRKRGLGHPSQQFEPVRLTAREHSDESGGPCFLALTNRDQVPMPVPALGTLLPNLT